MASCDYEEQVGDYVVVATGELTVHRELGPQV